MRYNLDGCKLDNCPACNANWIGEPIPEDIRQHYSPPYYWRREIGIDGGYAGIYDGLVALRCPDCEQTFPVNSSPWALQLYEAFKVCKPEDN